ncbi:hypothetical protein, partial [Vibrio parahaemolyticus]|uniref:hypothetical protein n=1 Tax=Vibrio parahaemolyticus TaxID=670 RepID=UPI001C5D7FA7
NIFDIGFVKGSCAITFVDYEIYKTNRILRNFESQVDRAGAVVTFKFQSLYSHKPQNLRCAITPR